MTAEILPVDPLAPLHRAAEERQVQAEAENTRATYAAQRRPWEAFAALHDLAPYPADARALVAFLEAQAAAGTNLNTLSTRLAAIRRAHLEAEAPTDGLDSAEVRRAMAAIRATVPLRPKRAAPIRPEEMRALIRATGQDKDRIRGRRDACLVLLGWHSMLRRSELTGLRVTDLEIGTGEVILTLDHSKTNQTGEAERVHVGATGQALCPVAALWQWLEVREVIGGEWLYPGRTIAREWTPMAPMSGAAANSALKRIGKNAGLPGDFLARLSGHSLRRGGATTALEGGAPIDAVQRQARHRKTDTTMSYVDEVQRTGGVAKWMKEKNDG